MFNTANRTNGSTAPSAPGRKGRLAAASKVAVATLLVGTATVPVSAAVAAPEGPTDAVVRVAQSTDYVARHGLTGQQYQEAFDLYVKAGYRLVHVDGYGEGSNARYAAIWVKKSGPAWVARHGLTSQQYQRAFDHYVGLGYRLVHVDGYGEGSNARYAAIWEKSSGPAWVARHGLTRQQYQGVFDRYVKEGYRLVHVSGYGEGANTRYAAIWVKTSGPAWVARSGVTSQQFQDYFDRYVAAGYRLVHHDVYGQGSNTRHAGIWEKKSGSAWVSRSGLTSQQYQAVFDQLAQKGYRLVDVSGNGEGSNTRYAGIWEK